MTCNRDDGDIAWMLMSTVLVLSMFPGVAFFEAGLLRKKNTTSIVAQVFCGLTILSLMWLLFGFSLTFGGDRGGFIGTFDDGLFFNVAFDDCYDSVDTIPTALFALFQMMFACITPLLMTGAYAERLAWKPFLIFTIMWEILVYYFVAHWVWAPKGWLAQLGVQDFAGGIVLHTTAGVSSLVAVAMLGRRHNFSKYHGEFPYSSLPTAAIGATLLWTGWFGFNGGSALGANSVAIAAVVNSQIGATASAFVYMSITAYRTGRPSAIAMMNGAIGGLAGVTPAAGFIHPQAALLLGAILGVSIDTGIHLLKLRWHFDDALDVSTVHGVTGIIGSLFIGFAGYKNINPNGADGIVATHGKDGRLLGVQLLGVVVCGAWAAFWTFVILKVISKFMPLRVHHSHERQGLDQAIFSEVADNINAPLLNSSITSTVGTDGIGAHGGSPHAHGHGHHGHGHGGHGHGGHSSSHTLTRQRQNSVHAIAQAVVEQMNARSGAPGSTRTSMAGGQRPAATAVQIRGKSPSSSVSSQSEEEDGYRREETAMEQLQDSIVHGQTPLDANTIAAATIIASTVAMHRAQSSGGLAHAAAAPAVGGYGTTAGQEPQNASASSTVDALFEVIPTNQSIQDSSAAAPAGSKGGNKRR